MKEKGRCGGVYEMCTNNVIVSTEHHTIGALVHELAHKSMDVLFKNTASPYLKNSPNAEKEFSNVVINVLKNIYQYFIEQSIGYPGFLFPNLSLNPYREKVLKYTDENSYEKKYEYELERDKVEKDLVGFGVALFEVAKYHKARGGE